MGNDTILLYILMIGTLILNKELILENALSFFEKSSEQRNDQ